MRAKEFLIEYRNPNNPERYVYDRVDFLREPHFVENLQRMPKHGVTFTHMSVAEAKPLVDKLAKIRKQIRNMLEPGKALYVIDRILKFSILIERAYNQPNTPEGKNIYYLVTIMPPTINGEFIMPWDFRTGGGELAPRFDINTRKIIEV